MLSLLETVEVLKNEMACVSRANTCDRDCGNCELVLPDEIILSAYRNAISIIENLKTNSNFDVK